MKTFDKNFFNLNKFVLFQKKFSFSSKDDPTHCDTCLL